MKFITENTIKQHWKRLSDSKKLKIVENFKRVLILFAFKAGRHLGFKAYAVSKNCAVVVDIK